MLLTEQWRTLETVGGSPTPTRRKGDDSESLRKCRGSKEVRSRAGGGAVGMQRKAPDHTEGGRRERIGSLSDSDDEGNHPRHVLIDEFDLRNERRQ